MLKSRNNCVVFVLLLSKLTYVLLDIAILELFPELKVRRFLTFHKYTMLFIVSALSLPFARKGVAFCVLFRI